MRAGTGAFPAPYSDRHLQGATGVLCLVFGSSLRTLGAKSGFWGRFAAKRDSQSRVEFGASAGVLDTPDGH